MGKQRRTGLVGHSPATGGDVGVGVKASRGEEEKEERPPELVNSLIQFEPAPRLPPDVCFGEAEEERWRPRPVAGGNAGRRLRRRERQAGLPVMGERREWRPRRMVFRGGAIQSARFMLYIGSRCGLKANFAIRACWTSFASDAHRGDAVLPASLVWHPLTA